MSPTAKTPRDFPLPEEVRVALEGFSGALNQLAWFAAEQLEGFGLSEDEACSAVSNMLVTEGCSLSFHVAMSLHLREPDRTRWIEVTGETFDRLRDGPAAKDAMQGAA